MEREKKTKENQWSFGQTEMMNLFKIFDIVVEISNKYDGISTNVKSN